MAIAQKEGNSNPTLFAPRPRIARLKVRFLRNEAISKNGRVYPAATVSRLVQSGRESLALNTILTCFTSHAAADMDDVCNIAGKVGDIYREGEDAFAWLDIPDTSVGRDMVSLAQNGYLRNVSIRASNAQLAMEKGYNLPVVRGDVQLEGIDFTTRPGLDSASIQSVVIEKHKKQTGFMEHLIDTFDFDVADMVLEMDKQPTTGLLAEHTRNITEMNTRFERNVDELKALIKQRQAAQQPRRQNELTRLLREEMHPSNWEQIADVAVPLPKTLNPKWGLHIMGQLLSGMIELHNQRASQMQLDL